MGVDDHLRAEAAAAAHRVTELEEQLTGATADYRRRVRALHLAGASMREIGEALGLSHQRVHQMIEGGGVRRWRRRRPHDPPAPRACSFCARPQHQVRKLVAGPDVYICDPCILAAVGVSTSGRATRDAMLRPVPPDGDLHCSFCGENRAALPSLVAGPNVEDQAPPSICGQCVGLCGEILSEQLR